MSNALNKTLASALLAAAAVGANAQPSRDEQRQAEKERISTCYTVGEQKGVERFPLTEKALQQDRSANLVGCIYNAAAGGELIVVKAHDLSDPKDAANYGAAAKKIKDDELKAATKLAGKDQKRDENGNVVTDTAKEVKDTANNVKKGVDAVNGAARAVDSVNKTLKRFGF